VVDGGAASGALQFLEDPTLLKDDLEQVRDVMRLDISAPVWRPDTQALPHPWAQAFGDDSQRSSTFARSDSAMPVNTVAALRPAWAWAPPAPYRRVRAAPQPTVTSTVISAVSSSL